MISPKHFIYNLNLSVNEYRWVSNFCQSFSCESVEGEEVYDSLKERAERLGGSLTYGADKMVFVLEDSVLKIPYYKRTCKKTIDKEIIQRNMEKDERIKSLLLSAHYYMTYNSVPYYIQEKVKIVEELEDEHPNSDIWGIWIREIYKRAGCNFEDFPSYARYDLHSANFGFKFNGDPVIVDYVPVD